MKVLFWGLTLLIISLILHVIIWKNKLPRNQKSALIKLFFFVLFSWVVIIVGQEPLLGSSVFMFIPTGIAEYLHVVLLFISMAFAYISFYTAIEADSPSLKTIIEIQKAGLNGLAKDDLFKSFNGDLFLKSRLRHLVQDKMIIYYSNRYTISSKGLFLLQIVNFWRKILRIPHDIG